MSARPLAVAGLMAASLLVGLATDVSVSFQYGELVMGPRFAPQVCADLILNGRPTFYAGTECDY